MDRKKVIIAIILFVFLGLTVFTFANPDDEVSQLSEDTAGDVTPSGSNTDNNNLTDDTIATNDDNNDSTRGALTITQSIGTTSANDSTTGNESGTDDTLDGTTPTTPLNPGSSVDSNADDNNGTGNDNGENADTEDYKELIALVDELIKKVNEADELGKLTDAREFNIDKKIVNSVTKVTDSEVKKTLEQRLNSVLSILNDTTNPEVLVNGEAVKATYNGNVDITVEDMTATKTKSIKLNGEEIDNIDTLVDGNYEITIIDAAYNETTIKFAYDATAPKATRVEILNNTHYDSKEDVTLINKGETLRVMVWFDEDLKDGAKLTIDGDRTVTLRKSTALTNESKNEYVYYYDYIIRQDLVQGEVKFVVNEYADEVGNAGADITEIKESNYGIVIYDSVAPVPSTVAILNVTHLRNNNGGASDDLAIANIGDQIRVYISFEEELAVLPKLVVGTGTPVDMKYTEAMSNETTWTYYYDYELTDNDNLTDGEISFKVYSYADEAGNTSEQKAANHKTYNSVVLDTTAPQLSLNGDKNITLETGVDTYTEMYATMTDEVDGTNEKLVVSYINYRDKDGNWVGQVDFVDTTKLGEYKVVYEYSDAAGNAGVDENDSRHAKVMRVVNVVDTTGPELTLNGDETQTLEAGTDTYIEKGAKATDNYDQDKEVNEPSYINYYDASDDFVGTVSKVDMKIVGRYELVYSTEDSNGNKSNEVIRTVYVKDTTAPYIELNGDDVITLEAGVDTYTELGAKVIDNVDPVKTLDGPSYINLYDFDLKHQGRVSSVDMMVVGKYNLVYVADKDSSGNEAAAKVTRTVYVKDTIAPTLTLEFTTDQVEADKNATYTEPKITVSDYVTKEENIKIDKDCKVDMGVAGTYTCTYTATDEVGNSTSETLTVTVVDTTKAKLGSKTQYHTYVEVNSIAEYVQPDVETTDNSSTPVTVEKMGCFLEEDNTPINTSEVGKYYCRYKMTDASNNVSTQKVWVHVVDTTRPELTGISSGVVHFGKINFTISDNSNKYSIYYGNKTTSCDALIANGTKYTPNAAEIEQYKNGATYDIQEDGSLAVCVVDESNNKYFINNIIVKKEASYESIVNAINNGAGTRVVLPTNTTLYASDLNVPGNITINGNSTSKIIGKLVLNNSKVNLYNLNIESTEAALEISPNVKNVNIHGGTYKTTGNVEAVKLQGAGTIRALGNNSISVRGMKLYGGIHLLNYNESTVNLYDNTITLEYPNADSELAGIVITTDGTYDATAIYNANKFNFAINEKRHYVLVHDLNFTTTKDKVSVSE